MRTPADRFRLVDDRPEDGVFRVHRDAFRDPDVFAREMAVFFERGWVYVGHASQLPAAHDFMTLALHGQPMVVMRGGDGTLRAFHNACRHKGALVCHEARGCRRVHVCQYHGWSYASDGRNVAVKAKAEGCYSPAFDAEGHDLAPVASTGAFSSRACPRKPSRSRRISATHAS